MNAIASGFLLRAVAGAAAADVHLSSWFLIVATFGSLFVAASKRHAEFLRVGQTDDAEVPTRPRSGSTASSTSVSCSTAHRRRASPRTASGRSRVPWYHPLWSGLSVAPFVLGIFRYALLVDGGGGESPEDLLLRDGALLGFGVAWAACLSIGLLSS